MFIIGEASIEEDIAHEMFGCNVAKCKGACCSLPGHRGAPLRDDEIQELELVFPVIQKYLSEMSLSVIALDGLYEGEPGQFATACVDDNDCVFVYYEDGVARCSLEKAYIAGETAWRKPISCQLFPIRVSSGETERVRYERIPECSPGIDFGKMNNIPLHVFLKDPLIRKFGAAWYDAFEKECDRRERMLSSQV